MPGRPEAGDDLDDLSHTDAYGVFGISPEIAILMGR